ncbi:hypothetical protein [Nostoc sp. MG11]|uniref:hypothetical protein n=1 Tax=Nostoc sp. MG11 TaxID=2721166 RepID=UPI001867BB67|nr:hypothetical protein [Nostoc sp. MG11]
MQLENYFEFLAPDDIRIKGHRIGIRYLELSQRLLVTDNRKSMPGHLKEHWENGGHIWGLVWLRSSGNLSSCLPVGD